MAGCDSGQRCSRSSRKSGRPLHGASRARGLGSPGPRRSCPLPGRGGAWSALVIRKGLGRHHRFSTRLQSGAAPQPGPATPHPACCLVAASPLCRENPAFSIQHLVARPERRRLRPRQSLEGSVALRPDVTRVTVFGPTYVRSDRIGEQGFDCGMWPGTLSAFHFDLDAWPGAFQNWPPARPRAPEAYLRDIRIAHADNDRLCWASPEKRRSGKAPRGQNPVFILVICIC